MIPIEIVCAVLEIADWRSLLRAKLVCTVWYHATQSRQLWYSFVKKLTTDNTITKLEGRVEDYTLEELQHWVIQKLRAREAWFSKDSPLFQVRLRFFPCPISGYYPDQEFELLPGGRWVLGCVLGKGIISYDLDSNSEIEEHVLVRASEAMNFVSPYNVPEVHLWIDHKNPTLSLRMVVWEAVYARLAGTVLATKT